MFSYEHFILACEYAGSLDIPPYGILAEQEDSTMGALPKQRTSHARQGERRSHHHLTLPQLVACPQCRKPRRAHHACPNCGTYRGRQVFYPKTKKQ
jgi:large subunit ribosomal protein L32